MKQVYKILVNIFFLSCTVFITHSQGTAQIVLPENIPASPRSCTRCQVDELYVCGHTPVTNVPRSYDVDDDNLIGLGDKLLVQRYLNTIGEGPADGRREDANGDGQINAQDLSDLQAFFDIVTGNGELLPDICGICGGDGTSCDDCAGIPKGNKVRDECGVCDGPGPGECGCNKVKDCAGVCDGTAVEDECGVCNGDNSTCKDCAGVINGDAELDECGVCNGPGKTGCDNQCFSTRVAGECGCNDFVKDCAGVCNGDAVVDECGVCNGDGSTCEENECRLYSLELYELRGSSIDWGMFFNDGRSPSEFNEAMVRWTNTENEPRLSCLENHLRRAQEYCAQATRSNPSVYDQCVTYAYFLNGNFDPILNRDQYRLPDRAAMTPAFFQCDNGEFYSVAELKEQGLIPADPSQRWVEYACFNIMNNRNGWGHVRSTDADVGVIDAEATQNLSRPRSLIFYMDENCNPVTNPEASDVNSACSQLTLLVRAIGSPISLIWEKGYDIENQFSITDFKLNLASDASWYIWKGSKEAPLLVYDPKHTGVVTSAKQLFGNWTFGGKVQASLNNEQPKTSAAWRDGFEALQTLDSDFNGKVDGEELESLALWFDENRDGVSQPGEVISITKTGVKALFYKVDERNKATGSIIANIGYEREIDGKIVTGKAIDWYGEGSELKSELLAKLNATSLLCGAASQEGIEFAPVTAEAPSNTAKATDIASVQGMWKWKAKDALGGKASELVPGGYLSFMQEAQKQQITGYSFNELNFAQPDSTNVVKNMISMVQLTGALSKSKSGASELHFALAADKGLAVTSTATLSKDGFTLEGTSNVEGTYQGRAVTFTYNWTATKVK